MSDKVQLSTRNAGTGRKQWRIQWISLSVSNATIPTLLGVDLVQVGEIAQRIAEKGKDSSPNRCCPLHRSRF